MSVLASLMLVCCRIDTLVCSGIPGISLSAMARNSAQGLLAWPEYEYGRQAIRLLDFPEPFLPTNAYRLPAFKRSFALVRISVPSAEAFPLPLPFVFSAPAETTVMLRPSMSSY